MQGSWGLLVVSFLPLRYSHCFGIGIDRRNVDGPDHDQAADGVARHLISLSLDAMFVTGAVAAVLLWLFWRQLFLLIAASLAVWPRWIQSWVSVMIGYPRYSTPPLAKELLGSSLGNHVGTPLIALLLIAALVIAWRGRAAAAGSYEFWLTLSILLSLTTITLLPGQSVCDHIILLPGNFLTDPS